MATQDPERRVQADGGLCFRSLLTGRQCSKKCVVAVADAIAVIVIVGDGSWGNCSFGSSGAPSKHEGLVRLRSPVLVFGEARGVCALRNGARAPRLVFFSRSGSQIGGESTSPLRCGFQIVSARGVPVFAPTLEIGRSIALQCDPGSATFRSLTIVCDMCGSTSMNQSRFDHTC